MIDSCRGRQPGRQKHGRAREPSQRDQPAGAFGGKFHEEGSALAIRESDMIGNTPGNRHPTPARVGVQGEDFAAGES